MVAGFSNPLAAVPYRPGPRSRQDQIAQSLMKQGSSTEPTSNKWTALARIAQGLLGGYMSKLDQDDRSAADAALMRGATGPEWINNMDTGGANQTPIQGAMSALGGLEDNQYASNMRRRLFVQQLMQDQGRATLEEQREHEAEVAKQQHGRAVELKSIFPPLKQVPGRHIPYPGAVAKQLVDIAAAKKPTWKIDPDNPDLQISSTGEVKRLPKQSLTVAQKKVDEEFGREYATLIAGGGLADVQKNLAQLDEVVTALEGGSDDLTGPFIGALPDWLKASALPKATAIQDAVEEVVQRNLRLILGAQFTEREGMRLIARAYNPRLEEAENVKRIRRLRDAIEAAARAKFAAAKYYEEWGTLVDYKGSMRFSLSDIEAATVGDPTEVNLPEGVTNEDIEETMRANNMTRQQVMDRLKRTR